MNERFVADPICCDDLGDVRFLLSKFGHETGRYLIDYPQTWDSLIAQRFTDINKVKLVELLKQAALKSARLRIPSLQWNEQKSWAENAISLKQMQPPKVNEVIAADNVGNTINMDDLFHLSPTAEEAILAQPDEYVRVCKPLLQSSEELYFIDPYLNPCQNDVWGIVEALLNEIKSSKQGKAMKFVFFARSKNLVGEGKSCSWLDLESKLQQVVRSSDWPAKWHLKFYLIDDDGHHKMHARYLLSIKGAVRLDQGFKRLTGSKRVNVGPVAKAVHNELFSIYHEKKPFKVVHEFTKSIS